MSASTHARIEPPSEAPDRPRPKLRLLHHMARSGGTLMSKCLGCMDGVLLLSEIHPRGARWFNPLVQAQRWFALFSPSELEGFRREGQIDFAEAIGRIGERAGARGLDLVLRDWSHLDFTGVPFVPRPTYRLLLADALRARFELVQTCTVRHPIDQWLSVSRLQVVQGRLFLEPFLLGYRRFAELAVEIGFLRYEDVVAAPATGLAELCRRLELRFDPTFERRWASFDRITGDVGGSRGGGEIRPVPRRPVERELLEAFGQNEDYRRSLELLGYQHPVR